MLRLNSVFVPYGVGNRSTVLRSCTTELSCFRAPVFRCSTTSTSVSSLLRFTGNTLLFGYNYLSNQFNNGDLKSYLVSLAPIACALGVSYQLGLGLEWEIQVAVLRSFSQLVAIGLLLKWIFVEHPIWSVLLVLVMIILAANTAGEQADKLPNSRVVATAALAFGASSSVAFLVLFNIFPLESGYLVAVIGNMLGSAMIMVGRTLKTLQDEVIKHSGQIETALALGATPSMSVQEHVQRAFMLGMTPMVDAVKVMGLVSLPGNLAGLLMGGVLPLEAVRTQIKLMNGALGAAALSCLVAVVLGSHMLFTPALQLRND